jgi:hypothetical protein
VEPTREQPLLDLRGAPDATREFPAPPIAPEPRGAKPTPEPASPAKATEGTISPEDTSSTEDTSEAGNSGDTISPEGTSSTADTTNPETIESSEDTGGTTPAGQPVTVVPGVPRYHRSDCILIRFMGDSDLQKMPVEAAKKNGCSPCRACQPDGGATD